MGIKRERGMSYYILLIQAENIELAHLHSKSVIKPKIELESGIYCTPVTVMLILDTLYLPF